jgi:hypothetical protein
MGLCILNQGYCRNGTPCASRVQPATLRFWRHSGAFPASRTQDHAHRRKKPRLICFFTALIITLAGGAGDRWRNRRRAVRAGGKSGLRRFKTVRATRLVTPGSGIRENHATESATETKPPVRIALGGRQEANLSLACSGAAQARVKRWGKSPPLRWRHRRHGKPRVEQGQIGG